MVLWAALCALCAALLAPWAPLGPPCVPPGRPLDRPACPLSAVWAARCAIRVYFGRCWQAGTLILCGRRSVFSTSAKTSLFPLRTRFELHFGCPGQPLGASGRPFWLPGVPFDLPCLPLGRPLGRPACPWGGLWVALLPLGRPLGALHWLLDVLLGLWGLPGALCTAFGAPCLACWACLGRHGLLHAWSAGRQAGLPVNFN